MMGHCKLPTFIGFIPTTCITGDAISCATGTYTATNKDVRYSGIVHNFKFKKI